MERQTHLNSEICWGTARRHCGTILVCTGGGLYFETCHTRQHSRLYHQSVCGYSITYNFPAYAVSGLDFADDIALLSHNNVDAQSLLTAVEQEVLPAGLKINRKKTEYMLVGDFKSDPGLTVIEGPIARVDDFKYLGSLVVSSRKDFEVLRAQAWQACKRMYRVWQSNVSHKMKVRLFQATVETVLLYGAEAWTLTKGLERALDGTYTRLLRYALGIKWQDHQTNVQVYQSIQPVTERLRAKRLKFAGHCTRMNSYTPQPVCQLVTGSQKQRLDVVRGLSKLTLTPS